MKSKKRMCSELKNVLCGLVCWIFLMIIIGLIGCGGGSSGGGGGGTPTGTTISGTIEYSPSGNLDGITVTATNSATQEYSANTNSTGNFSIVVPNGTYTVVAKFNGGNLELNDNIVINGQSYNLGSVQCGAISGRVFLPDGTSPDTIFIRVPESRTAAWPDPTTGEWALALIMTSQTQTFSVQYWESSGAYKSSTIQVEVTRNKNTPLGDYFLSYAVGHILEESLIKISGINYTPSDLCIKNDQIYISSWDLFEKVICYDIVNKTFSFTNLPFSNALSISGIGFDGNSIYIVLWNSDGQSSTIKKLSSDFATVENTYTVNIVATGISFDSSRNTWLCSRDQKTIYNISSNESYLLGFPLHGIYWNGSDLWAVGNEVVKKFKFNIDNVLEPIVNLEYNSRNIQGICLDSQGFLWVIDYNSKKILLITGE